LSRKFGKEDLVGIAVNPNLCRFSRSYHGVSSFMKMGSGMAAVEGRVAAVYLAAGLADTQVNPPVTAVKTFLTDPHRWSNRSKGSKVVAGFLEKRHWITDIKYQTTSL
jgi:hypothetical protein